MSNLNWYGVIAMSAAAILPPLAAAFMVWHTRKSLRQMNRVLNEMRTLNMNMHSLVSAPAKLRRMSNEIRDSISRIQEEKP